MSEIILSASVAQAIEVMSSLLNGSLCKWVDSRVDLYGHNFQTIWGNCQDKETESFFKRRIRSFSSSLNGVRIMKITPELVPIQKIGWSGTSDVDSSMVKIVHFYLGNEEDPSLIETEILFEKNDAGDESDREIWGRWEISYRKAITCRIHHDKKFINYVVLGLDAISDDD